MFLFCFPLLELVGIFLRFSIAYNIFLVSLIILGETLHIDVDVMSVTVFCFEVTDNKITVAGLDIFISLTLLYYHRSILKIL